MRKINLKSHKKFIIGIDEAGRGPLAGPVTLAAVACPKTAVRNFFKGVKDSKHLSPKGREEWFKKIKEHPKILYSTASVGAQIIDRIGIAPAIRRAVGRLLIKMDKRLFKEDEPIRVLLDGSLKAPEKYLQKTIIKGDEKIPVIAAASIVAKISRDRKMRRFSGLFPQYSFDIHKGYGTRLHYKLLKKHGLSPIHRKTFLSSLF